MTCKQSILTFQNSGVKSVILSPHIYTYPQRKWQQKNQPRYVPPLSKSDNLAVDYYVSQIKGEVRISDYRPNSLSKRQSGIKGGVFFHKNGDTAAAKMHFALPPRKSSHPPPYERAFKSSPIRRKQIQLGATIACVALLLIWLGSRLLSSSSARPPAGTPEAVVVTLLDPDSMSKEYMSRIKENRIDYADRYGSCEKDFSILSQSIKKKPPRVVGDSSLPGARSAYFVACFSL